MKKSILIFSFFVAGMAFAQLDVTNFRKFQWGVMHDKTTITGLYALQDPQTNQIQVDLEDYKTNINAEFRFIESTKSYVGTGNYEGFIYLLARLASMKNKKELFYDFDTYLDPLSANDCHNIKLFSGPQYNEVARFSNNHICEVTSSKVIKNTPVFVGVNASLRTIGVPPRYTSYNTEVPANKYVIFMMAGTWKILYGINIGYRKNIGNKIALFLMSGINRGINKKNYEGTNGSTAIQIRYNPFISTTLYFGKKIGGYVGLYWDMIEGKKRIVGYNQNLVSGSQPNETIYYTKQRLQQMQLKIGFYITRKKENQ